MKIAHIVCAFSPYYGGIGKVAEYMAEQLILKGHEIDIITPSYNTQKENNTNLNFTVKRITPFIKFGKAAFIPSIFFSLNKYDIIHFHYPFFGTTEILWLYKLLNKNSKIVISYHMDFIADTFFKKIMSIPSTIISPSLFKRSNKIIVSSLDYVNHSRIKKFYTKNKEKFIEIPFAADPLFDKNSFNNNESKILKTKYNIPTDKKILLFVGGLDNAHYFKGLDYLLKALKYINIPSHLVIVGDGDLKQKYLTIAKELGILNKIIFVGRVSDTKLVELYNLSDLFVLPSINMSEAFGIVLVNAMSCKKPVIASDLPGVRSVVEDNINGYLTKPKDYKDLVTKINTILKDKPKAEILGKNGFVKYIKNYNWTSVGNKLEELYKQL